MAIFLQDPNLERRRRMAEMMTQQAISAPAASPGAAISKMLMAYAGKRGMEGVRDEEAKVRKQQQEALAAALSAPDQTYAGLAQQLSGVAPELATQFAVKGIEQRMQKPQKREPIKVGESLVDPDTFEVLYKGEPKKSDYERRLELAGMTPGTPEAEQFTRKQMMRPGTQVNIGGPQAPGMREQILYGDVMERAKSARTRNQEYLAAGAEAKTLAPKIERGIELLDEVQTGPGQEELLGLKRVADILGFDVDTTKVASAEELQSILGDQIMARIAQTKGAVSDAEMALFTQYSAGFGKTPGGNRRILRFALAMQERNAEISDLVRAMRKQGATSIEIQDAVDELISQNDLGSILDPRPTESPVGVTPTIPNPPGAGGPTGTLTPGMDMGGGIIFMGYE